MAGLVVVAAATTGSVAALLMGGPEPKTVAAFPTASPPAASRGGAPSLVAESPLPDATLEVEPSAAPSPTPLRFDKNGMPVLGAYVGAPWPALTYTLKAADRGRVPAPFPKAVPGYRLKESFTSKLTVEESRFFTAFGDLPVRTASYDVCRQMRFYVRWMAVDPKAVVEATFVDAPVRTVQNKPVSGAGGWQSSYGCVQPALRIRPPAGTNPKKVVVVAQMQVWVRR